MSRSQLRGDLRSRWCLSTYLTEVCTIVSQLPPPEVESQPSSTTRAPHHRNFPARDAAHSTLPRYLLRMPCNNKPGQGKDSQYIIGRCSSRVHTYIFFSRAPSFFLDRIDGLLPNPIVPRPPTTAPPDQKLRVSIIIYIEHIDKTLCPLNDDFPDTSRTFSNVTLSRSPGSLNWAYRLVHTQRVDKN